VVHAASDPLDRSGKTDVEGTRLLLQASKEAGVRHVIYPGIVGSDRAEGFPYYRIKLAAEAAVRSGGVPWTILRATQFFELMPEQFFPRLSRFGVQLVFRRFRLQPVEVDEVADELVQLAGREASAMAPEFGGPEVLTMEAMARTWIGAAGIRRPILAVPLPGPLGRQVRAGALLTERARGKVTWADWLRRRFPRAT
jgi:uncharacterized protein YbjT (DUF2867 family)